MDEDVLREEEKGRVGGGGGEMKDVKEEGQEEWRVGRGRLGGGGGWGVEGMKATGVRR